MPHRILARDKKTLRVARVLHKSQAKKKTGEPVFFLAADQCLLGCGFYICFALGFDGGGLGFGSGFFSLGFGLGFVGLHVGCG